MGGLCKVVGIKMGLGGFVLLCVEEEWGEWMSSSHMSSTLTKVNVLTLQSVHSSDWLPHRTVLCIRGDTDTAPPWRHVPAL